MAGGPQYGDPYGRDPREPYGRDDQRGNMCCCWSQPKPVNEYSGYGY